MKPSNEVKWIRVGVIGTSDFEEGYFGFVLRDKARKATPIVEYVGPREYRDTGAGELEGFPVLRILLHPVSYSDGMLVFHAEGHKETSLDAGLSAELILGFCCGNLIARARSYIAHVQGYSFRIDPTDDEWIEWEADQGPVFESRPTFLSVEEAKARYFLPLYTTWDTWPPDRSVMLKWLSDEEARALGRPLDIDGVYGDGFYIIDREACEASIVQGPFNSEAEALDWAWNEYQSAPQDVPS